VLLNNYKCPSVYTFVRGISGIIANRKIDINDPEAVFKPVRPIIGIYIFYFTLGIITSCYFVLTFSNTFDNLCKS